MLTPATARQRWLMNSEIEFEFRTGTGEDIFIVCTFVHSGKYPKNQPNIYRSS
jgi:hypothetical protein